MKKTRISYSTISSYHEIYTIATGGCNDTPICPGASHDTVFVFDVSTPLVSYVWGYLSTYSFDRAIHSHSSLGYVADSTSASASTISQRPALTY